MEDFTDCSQVLKILTYNKDYLLEAKKDIYEDIIISLNNIISDMEILRPTILEDKTGNTVYYYKGLEVCIIKNKDKTIDFNYNAFVLLANRLTYKYGNIIDKVNELEVYSRYSNISETGDILYFYSSMNKEWNPNKK